MVKGTTRQVVVVKGPDPKLFDQAIFLVRDEVLMQGGITEEALLKEARQVCAKQRKTFPLQYKLFWYACGAGSIGFFWLLASTLL